MNIGLILALVALALNVLSIISYFIEESYIFPDEVCAVAGVLKWAFMVISYIPLTMSYKFW